MATEVGTAYVALVPSARGFAAKMQSEIGGDVARVGSSSGDAYGREFSSRASKGIGGRAKSIFSGLARTGPLVAAAAGVAVGKVISGAIGEAREAAVVGARTQNVIKTMGGAANVSAKHVADLAGALSNKSAMDDEAIQSGQNLLLTFGNVANQAGKGNDIFDQTSKLMVDMSAAMGSDMKGSAIQLGKALNDPVKGVSALSRVGVSFTAQQKEQIKTLQESGNTLGAQKIILGEVKKQFGGAAESMATPAERAKVSWGNFQEQIGTALLPTVDKLLTAFSDALPHIIEFGRSIGNAVGPVVEDVVPAVKRLWDSFSGGSGQLGAISSTFRDVFANVQSTVRDAITIVERLWAAFGDNILGYLRGTLSNVLQVIRGVFNVIAGVFKVVSAILTGDWSKAWEGVKQIVSGAKDIVVGIVKQLWNGLVFSFRNAGIILRAVFSKLWEGIKALTSRAVSALVGFVRTLPGRLGGVLSALPGLLRRVFAAGFNAARRIVGAALSAIIGAVRGINGRIAAAFSAAWNAAKGVTSRIWGGITSAASNGIAHLVGVVRGIKGKLLGALSGAGSWLKEIGRNIVSGLANGISSVEHWVTDKIKALTDKIPKWVRKKLGIESPSKVMAQLGRWIGIGLAKGITESSKSVDAAMKAMTTRATKALDRRFDGAKLKHYSKRFRNAVDDEFAALKRNNIELERVRGGNFIGVLSKSSTLYKRMSALGVKNLNDARAALANARQVVADYASSVRDSLTSFGSIVSSTGAASLENLLDGMRKRAADAEAWVAAMQQLQNLKLNKTTLDQLYQAGPESALATAQAIAAGGAGAVDEINLLSSKIASSANTLAKSASEHMYGSGVAAAQAVVHGLTSQEAAIVRSGERLIAQLVKAVRKASKSLDISLSVNVKAKSKQTPKLATGGRVTGETLVTIGEGREPETVLPDSLLKGLLTRAHSAGASSVPDVRVFIGERELTDIVRVEVNGAQQQQARQLAYGRRF